MSECDNSNVQCLSPPPQVVMVPEGPSPTDPGVLHSLGPCQPTVLHSLEQFEPENWGLPPWHKEC